jgi:hypothetical protein
VQSDNSLERRNATIKVDRPQTCTGSTKSASMKHCDVTNAKHDVALENTVNWKDPVQQQLELMANSFSFFLEHVCASSVLRMLKISTWNLWILWGFLDALTVSRGDYSIANHSLASWSIRS